MELLAPPSQGIAETFLMVNVIVRQSLRARETSKLDFIVRREKALVHSG
jgi:hypothetical protein